MDIRRVSVKDFERELIILNKRKDRLDKDIAKKMLAIDLIKSQTKYIETVINSVKKYISQEYSGLGRESKKRMFHKIICYIIKYQGNKPRISALCNILNLKVENVGFYYISTKYQLEKDRKLVSVIKAITEEIY